MCHIYRVYHTSSLIHDVINVICYIQISLDIDFIFPGTLFNEQQEVVELVRRFNQLCSGSREREVVQFNYVQVVQVLLLLFIESSFWNIILSMQRNFVFATNSKFLIPISLQPESVKLGLFALKKSQFEMSKVYGDALG